MHTACSSSRLMGGGEGACLIACWDIYPPLGVGLETPRVGLETPQVWAWRSPWPDPSTFSLVVGLETYKACWDTTPPCEQNS